MVHKELVGVAYKESKAILVRNALVWYQDYHTYNPNIKDTLMLW